MDDVLQPIRTALAPEASADVRAAGAVACRAILAVLDPPPPVVAANAAQIANAVASLRDVPTDKLLDLAIARLRAALPADADVPSVQPLKFHIIPIPPRSQS